MTIIHFNRTLSSQLEAMMVPYIKELGDDTPEAVIREKLFPFIHRQLEAGIIRIVLAFEDDAPAGFSVYQIDAPESDWCKRPGWGFIREFYIAPEFRRSGYGRQLARYTEDALHQMGAENLYLTSDAAIPFWQRCGWKDTGEICSNDLNILEK